MSSDRLDRVFGALSDPTRRHVLEALLRDGSVSVPALTAELPITRQAVAKHLLALSQAGLIERAPAAGREGAGAGGGREVRYRPRPDALHAAATWIEAADRAWAQRLDRLKAAVEHPTGE